MRNSLLLTIALTVLVSLSGCAKYEYVITQPTEFAGRLTRQERVIARGPVTYHFVDQSSRVGIRIENTTGSALTIKGEESYIVTPAGESSPLRGGTIAAHTWTGITIPALVRTYGGGGGVSFGLGVGHFGHSSGIGTGVGVGVGGGPWNDGFYAPRDEVSWRWKDGTVRIHLVIENAGESAGDNAGDRPARVEHDFAIERRKVE